MEDEKKPLHEHGKATQFSSTNQPKNRGRKVSIRNQLKSLLQQDGSIRIAPKQVISINDDGSVEIKLPREEMLAMKLYQWALSTKGGDSIKAIQMIMEQIDGKAKQRVDVVAAPMDKVERAQRLAELKEKLAEEEE